MKRENQLKKVVSALLMAALMFCLGAVLAPIAGMAPAAGGGVLAILGGMGSLMQKAGHMHDVHVAGISMEVWVNHIVEKLFAKNQFLERSVKDDAYVNYKSVHVPNAGANPTIEKNRSLGGAATNTQQRTDVPVSYDIDEYTSDPFLITNAENVELSYNKRESVLRGMQRTLRQTVSNNMLYAWGATGTGGNILRTTGVPSNNEAAAKVVVAADVNSTATGNRYRFGMYDVIQAGAFLDGQDVSEEGRVMLLSAKMYKQLLLDMSANEQRDFLSAVDVKKGIIGHFMGFDFYKRSSTLTYTNAATPVKKAIGAAAAATDNDSVLFWQEEWVRRAVGETHMFETPNSAVHYGDVYSVLMRAGGALSEANQIGVGAIVQAAAA